MGPERNTSGYLAQKLYKPDSPLTTGKATTQLLQEKQHFTDAARSLSPEAKSMVPAMYGFQERQGPGGQLRHTSQHEYVPNVSSLRKDPMAVHHAQAIQDTVVKPLEQKGMFMRDIARVHEGQLAGNASNVGSTPQGPKVLDFLPTSEHSPVAVVTKGNRDLAIPASSSSGRMDTGYGEHNMPRLRKDVYNPSADYKMPSLAPPPGKPSIPPPFKPTIPARPMAAAGQLATRLEQRAPAALTAVTKPVGGALRAIAGHL
jgi:hypothetical protein